MNPPETARAQPPLIGRAPCSEADPLRVVVLVSGSGSNLQSLLDKSNRPGSRFKIPLVISNVGGVRALERAAAANVSAVVESHRDHKNRDAFERALVSHCERANAELIVLAGFMRVLTSTFIDAYTSRVINVHPALCPAFPGLHAPRQALEHGVRVTGCTVHVVDTGVDTGPILAQAAVPIEDNDDESSLTAKVQSREHTLLPRIVSAIARGDVGGPADRIRALGFAPSAPFLGFE